MVYNWDTHKRDCRGKWPNDLDCALCGAKCDGTLGCGPDGIDNGVIACGGCGFWLSYANADEFARIDEWAQYNPWEKYYNHGLTPLSHAMNISERERLSLGEPQYGEPFSFDEQPPLFTRKGLTWIYNEP